jgi:REP element-mobilizing transposase RayT
MTCARQQLVSLSDTPYYHCVARCVRRAWLWGKDRPDGQDYSHRKAWVVDRLAALTEVFAIDICAYAVMSNHYHLVLRVHPQQATHWSIEDVIQRWSRLFRLPPQVVSYQRGQCVSDAEAAQALALVGEWRRRLSDLSWFMRCLNEHLARRANAEDGCSGRFWEGRFTSQALLDDVGLLTAMMYVDLNPIRAGVAQTPETSAFTSIQARLQAVASGCTAHRRMDRSILDGATPVTLLPFHPHGGDSVIPFHFADYLQLLDWTGRAVCDDRRGHIPAGLPPLLARLHIEPMIWAHTMSPRGNRFGRAIGSLHRLRQFAQRLGQSWVQGLHLSQRLYGATR